MSFRSRILILVLAVGLVPLGVLGLWLTRTASRSGERLLRSRLDEGLAAAVEQATSRWLRIRSEILFLVDDPASQRSLRGSTEATPPASFREIFDQLDPEITSASVADNAGQELWTVVRNPGPQAGPAGTLGGVPGLSLDFAIYERVSGARLGHLSVLMSAAALLPPGELAPAAAGMVVGAFEPATGISLLPVPLDPELLHEDAFTWGGDRWLAVSSELEEPPLQVVIAAPLTPFVVPFEHGARRSTWLLVGVAAAGLLLAALVTGRMTRSLESLSRAADSVSRGDLTRRIDVRGGDEVSRLARAFNTMTDSLRSTLAKLSQREAAAAVGEFAASLAHEVRNPLTAIRIDLQSVEERLPPDSPLREPQARALREVTRLDNTVANTLAVARSGRIQAKPLDLRDPVDAAADAARPSFESRGARLRIQSFPSPIPVTGDVAALEQLFLNLMQNAAEALSSEDEAVVELTMEDGTASVAIRDSGPGMPAEVQERAFEPFFSTRSEGTGLGLPIARRIASAHNGELTLESMPDYGTTAVVTLPLSGEAAAL
ncbi:MAG: HAMP domain-containing sensor histidine kinase [Gemmatimonadales bacterium]